MPSVRNFIIHISISIAYCQKLSFEKMFDNYCVIELGGKILHLGSQRLKCL